MLGCTLCVYVISGQCEYKSNLSQSGVGDKRERFVAHKEKKKRCLMLNLYTERGGYRIRRERKSNYGKRRRQHLLQNRESKDSPAGLRRGDNFSSIPQKNFAYTTILPSLLRVFSSMGRCVHVCVVFAFGAKPMSMQMFVPYSPSSQP